MITIVCFTTVGTAINFYGYYVVKFEGLLRGATRPTFGSNKVCNSLACGNGSARNYGIFRIFGFGRFFFSAFANAIYVFVIFFFYYNCVTASVFLRVGSCGCSPFCSTFVVICV